MIDFASVSLESDEIVDFLKREIKLKEVCQNILYQKLINQAAEERDITVSAEEIQAEADKQRHAMRLEKAADTLAWLKEQKMTPDDWEAGIRDRLLAEKLAESLFSEQVEKFFAQNRLEFDQVLLYQIILDDEKLAQEVFYELEEREISFYQAAHLYDINERRRHQCGCEGKLYRWNLKPSIAAVVFGSPLGKVIGPIQTEAGYHILMVEEFIPADLTPQRYQELRDKMFQEWLANELTYMLHN
ncbi:peptidylprolyl isomerase [Coleofasciculus sp.]|uniref:peptidylprolyl isomerase n=1 Tax=Coleofasciculus sp. TaxID=3100458 RepID=UPI003A381BB2